MSSNFAIKVTGLSKCYQIYERPNDRLLQGIYGFAAKLCPLPSVEAKLRQRALSCSKQYWALHDISFELKKGGSFGIIGRNGSGKSTLLQLLCGTLNPTHGEIEVNGRVAALLELGSGFNPEYSGRENIYMNGQLLGLSKQQVEQRIDDIITFADIGDFIEQPVKTYSSGMFVRVAFAVIAHVDADILVIDEALAVGDAFFTQKCMRFLRGFMETGTILFVSHDTAAVTGLCSNTMWLDKGCAQQIGTAKEVSENYLRAIYEAMDGSGKVKKSPLKQEIAIPVIGTRRDGRLDWINRTNLRNDIQIFEFDTSAESFGNNSAKILSVNLFDKDDNPLAWITGGEYVSLKIRSFVFDDVYSPIIGFYVKDRLGQILFGDNTYMTYQDSPLNLNANQYLDAEFNFIMPILLKGEYSVCVAIAAGSNESHTPLEWINDAFLLKSESSFVATGLVGIPMQKIELFVNKNAE